MTGAEDTTGDASQDERRVRSLAAVEEEGEGDIKRPGEKSGQRDGLP
jgi:hypothetical protein